MESCFAYPRSEAPNLVYTRAWCQAREWNQLVLDEWVVAVGGGWSEKGCPSSPPGVASINLRLIPPLPLPLRGCPEKGKFTNCRP
ncbi:hypothetical protein NPIL_381121 [Nephila pilipes]|uniref:Uncharacterized protein n=1 Tax=Nephila pilipes TaxID=299642 RepID=A0A8X6QEE6_NEPPI|nr:hypothetical protein NPIL_381121 [Nephila pilipes]